MKDLLILDGVDLLSSRMKPHYHITELAVSIASLTIEISRV
jgi:hypothetical protein